MLYCVINTCAEYSAVMSKYCELHKSYSESKDDMEEINHCLICNKECKNNFGDSLCYENIFKNQGLCSEHNFLSVNEDKNNIGNLETIDAAQLLSLLFLSDISNNNFKSQFNRTCSEKIRTMLIDLSNIHTDLYFEFLSEIKRIVYEIYGRIRECQIMNGGDFGTYQLSQYNKFLTMSRHIDYDMIQRDILYAIKYGSYVVEYLIYEEGDNQRRNKPCEESDFKSRHCDKCDTCDIKFYTENIVMTVLDKNKKYIKRECVNCRKLSMNCDFILNEFNEKRKIIMNEYLHMLNSGNLNIDILIISFLFGENNARILYLK
jgi:ferredoxin